jgi:hypothetical protein
MVSAVRIALVGLGGVEKLQLAINYCYQVRESSSETWNLWIDASAVIRYQQSLQILQISSNFLDIKHRKLSFLSCSTTDFVTKARESEYCWYLPYIG